jgi:hypothetical protein
MDAIEARGRLQDIERNGHERTTQEVMAIGLATDVLNVLAGSSRHPVRAEREAMAAIAYAALKRYAL